MKVLTSSLSGIALCYAAHNLIAPLVWNEDQPFVLKDPARPYDAIASLLKDYYVSEVVCDGTWFQAKCRDSEDFGPESSGESLAILRAFVCTRSGAGAYTEVPDSMVLASSREAKLCNGVLTTELGSQVDLTAIQATLQKAFNLAGRSNQPQFLVELTEAYQSILDVTGQNQSVPQPLDELAAEDAEADRVSSPSFAQG